VSFKDHPALAAAVLSAALIAARLLSIARFDVSTAATILQISGTGTAVAGTTLTILPFALILATGFLAVVVFVDQTLLDVSRAWAWVLFSLAAGATLCLTATPLAIGTAVFVLAAILMGRYTRRSSEQVRIAQVIASSRLLRIQLTALLVVLALTPIILQRPWLPIQEVTMKDGSVHVGYVLGDSQGAVVIMSDVDRTIEFLNPESIKARSICSGRPKVGGVVRRAPQLEFRGSVLGTLLWGRDTPNYPSCPSD